MAVSLFPHNQTAYENVCAMLEKTGKAAVIHPTGTGKSFIGFKYAEDHPETKILWLAPSEYIFKTQLENWFSACASADAIQASNRTESGSWRVVGGEALHNITFLTYAKLSLLSEEELSQFLISHLPFTIVLDEFHRAGALHWGLGVDRLIRTCPNARILGLTATNIRYLDSQRDMAQELFDGHIASEMTLGEAIVRGILPAPKYVLSIFKYLGLSEHITWCTSADDTLCDQLLALLFSSGNFGRKFSNLVERTSILIRQKGFFQYLQNSGEAKWNAYHRHPALKPFCWIYQGCRVIRKTIRGKRGLKMIGDISQSRDRTSLLRELGIT